MGADDFVLPRKRRDVAYNPVTGQVNHVFRRDGGGWLATRTHPLTATSTPQQPLPHHEAAHNHHHQRQQHQQQEPERPLIAGIGAAEGSDHYKTSYGRFAEREPTSRDMLTLKKQQEAFKLDAGMQAYGRGAMASSRGGALAGGPYGGGYPAGFAAPHALQQMRENVVPNSGVARGTSLMAGLGSSLALAVPEFERSSVHGAARPKVTCVEVTCTPCLDNQQRPCSLSVVVGQVLVLENYKAR